MKKLKKKDFSLFKNIITGITWVPSSDPRPNAHSHHINYELKMLERFRSVTQEVFLIILLHFISRLQLKFLMQRSKFCNKVWRLFQGWALRVCCLSACWAWQTRDDQHLTSASLASICTNTLFLCIDSEKRNSCLWDSGVLFCMFRALASLRKQVRPAPTTIAWDSPQGLYDLLILLYLYILYRV